jgi:hypothetical protein
MQRRCIWFFMLSLTASSSGRASAPPLPKALCLSSNAPMISCGSSAFNSTLMLSELGFTLLQFPFKGVFHDFEEFLLARS